MESETKTPMSQRLKVKGVAQTVAWRMRQQR
jgi:hypothetical protein